MPLLSLGADMARLSKTGSKQASKTKFSKASSAKGRKMKPAKHRNAPAAKASNGRSMAELEAELDRRARELDEARQHQAATSEVLSAISRSPTDVRPVFDT